MPTHAEKRIVPYRPEQMFDLVADVEKYPEFLPWCVGARIKNHMHHGPGHEELLADLMIGYKMIREKFTSRVDAKRHDLAIDVAYTDGPFRYLDNHWGFVPHEQGCMVDFYVDFEFKNRMLQRIMGLFFNEAVRRMVAAFETRAHALYG